MTRPTFLAVLAYKLNDKPQLSLTEQRLDRAHDALAAADQEPLPYLERALMGEMSGRDNLVAAAELVAIDDCAHRIEHKTIGQAPPMTRGNTTADG
jgi:hypothetical protein